MKDKILLKLNLFKTLLDTEQDKLSDDDSSLLYLLAQDKEVRDYIKENLIVTPIDLNLKDK